MIAYEQSQKHGALRPDRHSRLLCWLCHHQAL